MSTTPDIGNARTPIYIGLGALLILVFGIGYWSVATQIAGAVIAPGQIQVESNRQVIQHPEGGVVGEILAKSGDRVAAGDVLIRFDGRRVYSELAIVEGQYFELLARKARLEAERDEAETIAFSQILLDEAAQNPEVQAQIDGQQGLFETRNLTIEQETSQLREQIKQIENQIIGAEAQLAASQEQSEMIGTDLLDQERLLSQGLTLNTQVIQMRMDDTRIRGEVGNLEAQVAQLRGQIAATNIEILRLRSNRREEATSTLSELQFTEVELSQRRLELRETIDLLEVRAPVDGVIYNSQIFAVNSVVQAAEPMMYIIPQNQPLLVKARIQPIDIDQVFIGQDTIMRFSAFDQRTTPELDGEVINLSADVFTDEQTGTTYYEVEVTPKAGEIEKLGDFILLPGMPVESFIRTADRTPLSYLLKPFTDYFNRAFREGNG